MHCYTLTIRTPLLDHVPSQRSIFPRFQNPRLITFPIYPPILPKTRAFYCNGIQTSAPKSASGSSNGAAQPDWKLTSTGVKNIDVATLGNLCVDIVLHVPELPPSSPDARKVYMDHLSASPPDKKFWEAGGNCNMAIAASRLGMRCAAIGHVGDEIYGRFLKDVLHDERINMVGMAEDTCIIDSSNASFETLLCWVLVDPLHRHGFCSRFDFNNEPAFSWMDKLSTEVKMAIKQSKSLFCNGYGFDELSPNLIVSSLEYAAEVGTSIFFDPGPRGKSLSAGTFEEKRALNYCLRMSDVLLLTSDEAEALTGIRNPILSGQELLRNGLRTKWVIVKLGSRGSILVTESIISCAPSFKVKVIDTVGCGDSFVAAVVFGFINNMPTVNTLAVANAVGAATAMGCGAGRNVASLKEVIQLMKASKLNEDDEFWSELFDKRRITEQIVFLSKMGINGSNNQVNCVPLENVVDKLLPTLEAARLGGKVPS